MYHFWHGRGEVPILLEDWKRGFNWEEMKNFFFKCEEIKDWGNQEWTYEDSKKWKLGVKTGFLNMKILMMKQNFCTEGCKQGVRMVQDQSSWLIRVIKFIFSGCFIISSLVFFRWYLDNTSKKRCLILLNRTIYCPLPAVSCQSSIHYGECFAINQRLHSHLVNTPGTESYLALNLAVEYLNCITFKGCVLTLLYNSVYVLHF